VFYSDSQWFATFVAGISSWDTGQWGNLAGSNILLCQHRPSGLMSKAEPWEQRGLTLCTLSSRFQKQKARSNPYMVIYNFIRYFTLVLHDFSPPSATWPSPCSDSSGFISLLWHPYLPATLSELRPGLFSSGPLPCYTLSKRGQYKYWLFLNHW
jgi:hypothetical protein